MNYDVRATTTDRPRETFHVTATTADDAIASAESHLYRAGWTDWSLDHAVISVRPV